MARRASGAKSNRKGPADGERSRQTKSRATTRSDAPPARREARGPAQKSAASGSAVTRSNKTSPPSKPTKPTRPTRATGQAKRAKAVARGADGRARAAAAKKAAAVRAARKPRTPRLSQIQVDRLLRLEETLADRIVGKREAIDRISRVIRVRLTQLDLRPERPKGMFLLVGPHGVGKSEIAYAVSEAVYGAEDRVVMIDLDEFQEEDQLARLGSSVVNTPEPVLVEGALTTPVRQTPQTVFLLRGLENAHPAMQRVLLQIFERGTFEDMLGSVSFRDAIFFVTVTFRRDEPVPAGIGFSRASRAPRDILRERLDRVVMPDFLDAFDDIVELPALTAEQVRRIARYKVDKVLARMQRQKKAIAVDEAVFESLIPDDLCRVQGAAFLNRTLEDRLFNPLARYLLTHRKTASLKVALEAGQVTIHEVTPGRQTSRSMGELPRVQSTGRANGAPRVAGGGMTGAVPPTKGRRPR